MGWRERDGWERKEGWKEGKREGGREGGRKEDIRWQKTSKLAEAAPLCSVEGDFCPLAVKCPGRPAPPSSMHEGTKKGADQDRRKRLGFGLSSTPPWIRTTTVPTFLHHCTGVV